MISDSFILCAAERTTQAESILARPLTDAPVQLVR